MSKVYQLVVWIYDRLLRAYPKNYRVEFESEMRDVFSQVAKEAAEIGGVQVGFSFLGELRDYPINLIREHWMNLKGKEVVMETNISSVSGNMCPRCGFSNPVEARYCANCGRAFIPFHSFVGEKVNNVIDSKTTLILFSLLVILIISDNAKHLINASLFYPLSYVILALGVGVFSVLFGWRMAKNPSTRRRLFLVLMFGIFIGMWFIGTEAMDWTILRIYVKPGTTFTYDLFDMETKIMLTESNVYFGEFYPKECERQPIACIQFTRSLEPNFRSPVIFVERIWNASFETYKWVTLIYIYGLSYLAFRSAQWISRKRMIAT